ncbi:MAG TPA: ABC transporter substrate-binding protein [Chloroflexota bacterium]|nr:ABC transporter substrate-binding protein [Chloroflexota bacterium]
MLAQRGIAVLIALLMAAACGPSASAPTAQPSGSPQSAVAPAQPVQDPALQALVDAARQEGALNVIYPLESTSDTVSRWTEGFNRLYGLNLDVRFTPGPPMPELAARVAQEAQAGRTASTDVFIGAESHINTLANAGALEPVDWASWAPNVRDPRLIAPGGVAVQLGTRTPGIAYNTNRISGDLVPATMQDLLKPQLRGQIASTPYAAGFSVLGSPEIWGEARTIDYVTKLADQVGGLIRCNEMDRLLNGEFDMLALDCGAEFRASPGKEALIGHVIPSDAAVLSYWYTAVPSHAAHPNAAKLWINYVMGREGQDILYQGAHADHHLVPGSHVAPDIEALQARGVKFTETDVAFYQRTDLQMLNRLGADLQRIVQKQ